MEKLQFSAQKFKLAAICGADSEQAAPVIGCDVRDIHCIAFIQQIEKLILKIVEFHFRHLLLCLCECRKEMITHKMICVNHLKGFSQGLLLLCIPLQFVQEVTGMKKEYKALYEKFGLNVVYYRKSLRVTQLQLAELLDIDRSHISAIELGNVGVSMDLIFKMCEVFKIKPKELFDFRD